MHKSEIALERSVAQFAPRKNWLQEEILLLFFFFFVEWLLTLIDILLAKASERKIESRAQQLEFSCGIIKNFAWNMNKKKKDLQ